MMHSDGDESLIGRFSNVEVRHAGQGFRLGRYPVHFHMIGEVRNSFVRSCSCVRSSLDPSARDPPLQETLPSSHGTRTTRAVPAFTTRSTARSLCTEYITCASRATWRTM
jgi:hypothetical protein